MAQITNYINTEVDGLDAKITVAKVSQFFKSKHFSHFPVTDRGVFIGNIIAEDVEGFDPKKSIDNYKYALEMFFVTNDMNWMEVINVFVKNETNVLPVLDHNTNYIGYYNLEEVFKFLCNLPFLQDWGEIIVLKKNILEYSNSQIAQIVESNNGKLLGLLVSNSDTTTVEITIKIQSDSTNEIIQTFRRYGYEIVLNNPKDDYISLLKEHADYLDKYLNI